MSRFFKTLTSLIVLFSLGMLSLHFWPFSNNSVAEEWLIHTDNSHNYELNLPKSFSSYYNPEFQQLVAFQANAKESDSFYNISLTQFSNVEISEEELLNRYIEASKKEKQKFIVLSQSEKSLGDKTARVLFVNGFDNNPYDSQLLFIPHGKDFFCLGFTYAPDTISQHENLIEDVINQLIFSQIQSETTWVKKELFNELASVEIPQNWLLKSESTSIEGIDIYSNTIQSLEINGEPPICAQLICSSPSNQNPSTLIESSLKSLQEKFSDLTLLDKNDVLIGKISTSHYQIQFTKDGRERFSEGFCTVKNNNIYSINFEMDLSQRNNKSETVEKVTKSFFHSIETQKINS